MRKEHTTSEVTEAEGLTDAQFFYGEIMELQRKCNMLEQEKSELQEEVEKANNRYRETLDREHRFCDAISLIKKHLEYCTTMNKKDIIQELEDITGAITIFGDHFRRNDPDLNFAAALNHVAERRFNDDSTNS